ncbi:hypothetical protein DL770_002595 [Monosporascus sp. CRB-9-2]|nr:hypothetical protein DL770_002595 [Monosporascus sp. CRB-9-2]
MADAGQADAGYDPGFVLYHYDPSKTAAAIFVSLFSASTILHSYQLAVKKTWYFIPFAVGGICQSVGYGGRIWSSLETPNWTVMPYTIQSLLILVAPALFAASIYMVLGRLIHLVNAAHYSVVPLKWLTKIFVTADVISFFMQGGGGAMLAIAKSAQGFQNGQNVIIGGLFVQLTAFSLFMAVAAVFHKRMLANPVRPSHSYNIPWQRYLWVLYAVSGLILVRSIFRVIEYLQGYNGSLQGTEYWLYIFDAMLMFVVMAILNVFHPSRVISCKAHAQTSWQSTTSTEEELQDSTAWSRLQGRHAMAKAIV